MLETSCHRNLSRLPFSPGSSPGYICQEGILVACPIDVEYRLLSSCFGARRESFPGVVGGSFCLWTGEVTDVISTLPYLYSGCSLLDAPKITKDIIYSLICLTLTVVHHEHVTFSPGCEPGCQSYCYGVECAHSSILRCFHAGPHGNNYLGPVDWRYFKWSSLEKC
jgi:hypothetical protein